jgi:hypothetical protein
MRNQPYTHLVVCKLRSGLVNHYVQKHQSTNPLKFKLLKPKQFRHLFSLYYFSIQKLPFSVYKHVLHNNKQKTSNT